MAKINLSYDTNTKDFVVDVNGQPLDGVREFVLFKFNEDDVEMSIHLDPVKEDGMTIHRMVRANKDGKLETTEDKKPIQKAFNEWLSPQK